MIRHCDHLHDACQSHETQMELFYLASRENPHFQHSLALHGFAYSFLHCTTVF